MSQLKFEAALLLALDEDTLQKATGILIPEEPGGSQMYPIPQEKLHITLSSIKACKQHKDKLSSILPSDIEVPKIVLGDCKFVYRTESNKITYVVSIENQSDLKDYVDKIWKAMELPNPEPDRFFHITLANNAENTNQPGKGNPFASIGDVSKKDFSLNESSESRYQVWFDLDGVLADFEGGLHKNEFLVSAKNDLDTLVDTEYPEYRGLRPDELKLKIKEDIQSNPNLKLLKKVFYAYNNLVYKVAGKQGFFENLELLPGAHEMVDAAFKITGTKPNVCTAPIGDENDRDNMSVSEKRKWVANHFGDKINHVEVTLDKGRVVKNNFDILIDDRQKYCDKFTDAGGTAIKHDTPSEKDKNSWQKTLETLKAICKVNESKWILSFQKFKLFKR